MLLYVVTIAMIIGMAALPAQVAAQICSIIIFILLSVVGGGMVGEILDRCRRNFPAK